MVETLENILLQVSKSPIIDEGKLEQATQLIIKSVIQGLAINRVGIWLYDDESACIQYYLLDANDENNVARIISPICCAQTRANCIANRASDHPATNELTDYLNKFGIVAMLDVPLRHRVRSGSYVANPRYRSDRRRSVLSAFLPASRRMRQSNCSLNTTRISSSVLPAVLRTRLIPLSKIKPIGNGGFRYVAGPHTPLPQHIAKP